MNIAVIKLKDIIKYAIVFITIVAILIIGINMLKKEEINEEKSKTSFFDFIKNSSFLFCLKMEMPIISSSSDVVLTNVDINTSKNILGTELSIMDSLKEKENTKQIENVAINENTKNEIKENEVSNNEIKEEKTENKAPEGKLVTEVISENNIKASFTNEGNNVQINNQTDYDLTDIINNPSYENTNKNKFVIYHTHTCESYTSSEKYSYEMTGNYRTTDLNYTVSRVADELAECLEGYGKTVVHDKTYHDYPAYNGSYGRSLKTMQKVLETNKDAEIAIDLHRDAVRKQ